MRIFCYSTFTPGRFWFRLFGIGLVIADSTKHKMLFSMRNGLKKYLNIGKYRISYLSYTSINK